MIYYKQDAPRAKITDRPSSPSGTARAHRKLGALGRGQGSSACVLQGAPGHTCALGARVTQRRLFLRFLGPHGRYVNELEHHGPWPFIRPRCWVLGLQCSARRALVWSPLAGRPGAQQGGEDGQGRAGGWAWLHAVGSAAWERSGQSRGPAKASRPPLVGSWARV